jgi:hypothetical protein
MQIIGSNIVHVAVEPNKGYIDVIRVTGMIFRSSTILIPCSLERKATAAFVNLSRSIRVSNSAGDELLMADRMTKVSV